MKWMAYQDHTTRRLGLVEGDLLLGCSVADELKDLLGDDGSRLTDAANLTLTSPERHRCSRMQPRKYCS